ncbi:hypothetical protein GCM10028777_06880 [Angustibacter speluncae]
MPHVALGTAHLFTLVDPGRSGAVLAAAWDAGVRRFDTAPSYGHGLSEPALGTFLAGHVGVEGVTTKVGLDPAAPDGATRRAAKAVARRVLPVGVAARLRGSGGSPLPGRFAPERVRAGAERSLRRLGGRVDRFLLHEVHAEEVDDGLVAELERLVRSGDVGAVGVATQNARTAAAVERLGRVATVAHVAAGPFDEPVRLPAHVDTVVGHGLLGSGGRDLATLRGVLHGSAARRDRWQDACATTDLGDDGLAEALLARATRLDLTDVLVATGRPERVARSYALASGSVPLPDAVGVVLDELVAAATDDARAA